MHNQALTPQDYWESYFSSVNLNDKDKLPHKHSKFLELFCRDYLKKDNLVLDLGCGYGRNAVYLAKQGIRVCGVDFSASAVALCDRLFSTSQLKGIFKQGTFENIPFPQDHFDAVICIASIDHVCLNSAQASVIEIQRVLKKDGVVLLTFDATDADDDRLHEAEVLADGTLKFVRGDQQGMLFRRYSDAEIRQLLDKQNLLVFHHLKNGARAVIYK